MSVCVCVSTSLSLVSWTIVLTDVSLVTSVFLCLYVSLCILTPSSPVSGSLRIYLLVFILLCFSIFTVVIVCLSLGDLVFFSLLLCDRESTPKWISTWEYTGPAREHPFLWIYVPDAVTLAPCPPLCICMFPYVYSLSFQNLVSYVSESLYHTVSPSMPVLLLVSYFVWPYVSGCMYMRVSTPVSLVPFLFIHLFIQQILTKHLLYQALRIHRWFRKCPCP